MQWALDEIRKIQKAARSGEPIMKPRVSLLTVSSSFDAYLICAMAGLDHGYSQRMEWTKDRNGEVVEGSFMPTKCP